ncbi:glycosyltransferase family 1 protein [Intrasporangium sp.]|uniref:glycosyltransferase family 4 protein n=1 Tax=Intrasporangium sp. TaxID=1925024 RepID=UPI0033658B38
MGAQVYQEQVARRAEGALLEVGADEWEVRRLVTRSVRSSLRGNRRLPVAKVAIAPAVVRRELGRLFYGRAQVSHRMNLELPPAPRGDIVTIHDVVAWRFPDESPPVPAAAEEARRAAAVICVSEFSASEAQDLLGIRDPHVVHNGVDAAFFQATPHDSTTLKQWGIERPFVLHAGGAARRKNLEALAAAWPLVRATRPDLDLVLAGPPHPRRTDLFVALPGTRLVGRLPDQAVPGLVAAASAVVVPSLYEGFGLPALEAMAAGVPVVAARTSSLPEVVADAGLLVEPTGAAIAEGIIEATSGHADVTALVDRGRARAALFTWERSAREHARVWASVGATPQV